MEQQITDLLNTIQATAPAAWDALVLAAWFDSVVALLGAMTVIIALCIVVPRATRIAKWAAHREIELLVFIGGLFIAIIGTIAFCVLFTGSTWLGLFHPEARAVHDLLAAITGD